jgi:hypothetical protein
MGHIPGVFTPAFNAVDLNDFDVIVVGWSGNEFSLTPDAQEVTDALIGRQVELSTWLSDGGGLVALSDYLTSNPYGYLPLSVTRVIVHGEVVDIDDPLSPLMVGLTDEFPATTFTSLSDWGTSYHNTFDLLTSHAL